MKQPPFASTAQEGRERRGRWGRSPEGVVPARLLAPVVPGTCPLPLLPGWRGQAGSWRLSASRAGAGHEQSPGEPPAAAARPERQPPASSPSIPIHPQPHPHPDALPLPMLLPPPGNPPARQPGALTWKRFFTQIFFMLLQSPAGPVTPAQARQDASPLLAGSPLSARRGGKRCSEHPPPAAAGDGGGRGRGSPGWALGRAGAVSMKHHWSAPPSILPPPASASASPPALAHSDRAGDRQGTGGGCEGRRRAGAGVCMAGAGAHPPHAGSGSTILRGSSPLPRNVAVPLSPATSASRPTTWGRS